MNKIILLLTVAVAVSGCETTGAPGQTVDPDNLPERNAHLLCLHGKVMEYAHAEGSPLELGIIASSSCGATRIRFHEALVKAKSRAYADGYIGSLEKEEPKMVAAAIIKRRARG